MNAETNGHKPLLSLEGVSKRFGPVQALNGVDFEVRADGKNCVLVEEAQSRMLTRQTDAKNGLKKPARSAEPDLAALRALS